MEALTCSLSRHAEDAADLRPAVSAVDEVADLRLDRELDGDLLVDQRPEPVELVLPYQVRPHR